MALLVISSCGPAAQNGAIGGFQTPSPTGDFGVMLVETQSSVIENTVSVIAGRKEGVGLRAFAGILPDQPVQPPISGNAVFSGDYSVAFIDEIAVAENFVTGRNTLLNGVITLDADLSDRTLTGSDGVLSVTSNFDGTGALTGTVDVLGVSGDLRGDVGDDRAFGAFHGADDTHLYSGGFVTHRNP